MIKRVISKYAQKMANFLISRLEIAMQNGNDDEFHILLNLGFSLNEWCIKREIELE